MARCKFGKVKSGPRKGRCRKSRVTRKQDCPKGRVKSGPRKGKCRKKRPGRRR